MFTEGCTENQNALSMFKEVFLIENHEVYEINWKNIVEPDRPQMTI
jgi:hypothetical protein